MSYTEYLRTKLAAEKKVVNIRNPTDASMYTTKKRMEAAQVFFQDGRSIGSLLAGNDRPMNNHAAVSSKKPSGKHVDASDYTVFRGNQGIGQDLPYTSSPNGKKILDCIAPPPPSTWKYASASDAMRGTTQQKSECVHAEPHDSDTRGKPLFVDNTISLSAMNARMITGECCDNRIEDANHTHSPGIQNVNNQKFAPGKHFFMRNPPLPKGPNVSNNKVGGYAGLRPGYVENKHGNAIFTPEIPKAPGKQGQDIAHMRINDPTIFHIKP